jgi:hypothetical protein
MSETDDSQGAADRAAPLPHEGVFVRLAPSPIEGIGVFAIAPIPKGTNIFANDRNELRWIEEAELERAGLSPEQRQLYDDFAVNHDGKLGVPKNFNLLTTGWYLNEPRDGEAANVGVTANLEFVALRDIAVGEELTLRYATFSEQD